MNYSMLKIKILGLYALNQYVFLFLTVSELVHVFRSAHHHFYFYVIQGGDSKSLLTICEINGRFKAVQTSVWCHEKLVCKCTCKDKEEQTERKIWISMETVFATLPGCFESITYVRYVFTNFWPYINGHYKLYMWLHTVCGSIT